MFLLKDIYIELQDLVNGEIDEFESHGLIITREYLDEDTVETLLSLPLDTLFMTENEAMEQLMGQYIDDASSLLKENGYIGLYLSPYVTEAARDFAEEALSDYEYTCIALEDFYYR